MNRRFKPAMFIVVLSILAFLPFATAANPVKGKRVVVIDPAHGGGERGVKLTDDIYEKNVTLIIAEHLKTNLEKTGKIQVIMTRNSDRDVTLTERAKAASDHKTDLFISIHVNAGFDKNASGFEIYFPGFKTPSGDKENSGEIVKDMISTRHLNESVRFSQLLRRQLEKVFPRRDRGLRESPIRIIQGLTIPSVVLETGFATRAGERKELLDEKKQKAVAEAIGKSVEEYF